MVEVASKCQGCNIVWIDAVKLNSKVDVKRGFGWLIWSLRVTFIVLIVTAHLLLSNFLGNRFGGREFVRIILQKLFAHSEETCNSVKYDEFE